MTHPTHPATAVAHIRTSRNATATQIPPAHSSPTRTEPRIKSLLSSKPVLWFLFLFNLVVSVAAGFALHGMQQVTTSAGMGAVAIGAGAALFLRRRQRA
jgi:hypothetical protein